MLREGKSTAGDFRIPSGCAVSSVFSRSGKRLDGSDIIRSIEIMHDRSNGLGGGFAGYGIYPEYAEQYAFHVFYNNVKAKEECEKFINEHFDVVNLSKIPIRKIPQITDEPLIWRYFVTPLHTKLAESQLDEDEFTARCVNRVNTFIDGAYIFSSGKNMGVFKAVGYPEDVGSIVSMNTPATVGRRTAATRRIPPAGGAVRTRLRCSTFPLSITAKSRPTMRTAAALRCTATTATF